MSRYLYSLIRFVPQPLNGEFINIGIILGNEEEGEWETKILKNLRRAKYIDEENILSSALEVIDKIESKIEHVSDREHSLFQTGERLNQEWLNSLSDEYKNVIQFTTPSPIISDSLSDAKQLLTKNYLVEVIKEERETISKQVAKSELLSCYDKYGLKNKDNLIKKARIDADEFTETTDFAIVNGRVVQLSQTWSFQINSQETLARDVKSWAWVIKHLRDNNARLVSEERGELETPSNVDVGIVFIPPETESIAFDEAQKAASELDIKMVPKEEADLVAKHAREIVSG